MAPPRVAAHRATAPKPTTDVSQMHVGGFARIAATGFGDPQNAYIWSMAWFDGKLYVGTSRNNLCNATLVQRSAWIKATTGCPDANNYLNLDMRAEIWAYTPRTHAWRQVYRSPLVNTTANGEVVRVARDAGYRSMAVYTDKHGVTALYVGTTGFGDLAHLLRSVDGVHFKSVGPAGLKMGATTIRALTPYAGHLFLAPIAGTGLISLLKANSIYMSDDPAAGTWTAASYIAFLDSANQQLDDLAVFNGQLYAATSNRRGFQLWRANAVGKPPYKWTAVLVNGADRGSASPVVTAMAVFHHTLYVGSASETIGFSSNNVLGCELIAVHPNDSWDLIVGDRRQTDEGPKAPLSGLSAGFGNHDNSYLWQLAVHDGRLYAGTYSAGVFALGQPGARRAGAAGFGLWSTGNGRRWSPLTTTGFGNPYNYGVRALLDTPVGLFLGTANPFARAPHRQGGAQVWVLPTPHGLQQPHGVRLGAGLCPMAHCDPGLDNNQAATIPMHGATQAWQYNESGVFFSTGLGCTSGVRIVVCAGTGRQLGDSYDAAYLYALDLQGHLLWDSRRLLDDYVIGSAPLLDNQDNVYASDDNWLISFTAQGVVRWRVPNPARSVIVSFNMLSSGYLVGQAGLGNGGRNLVLVINPQTGAVAGTLDLADTVNGVRGDYGTPKTISVVGNRLYTVTQFVPANPGVVDRQHHGRLFAIDVDGHGTPHVAWSFAFQGPSGGSPVVVPGRLNTIYFPGTGTSTGSTQDVMLLAVQDLGGSGRLLWTSDLTKDYGIPYPTSAPAPGIQSAVAHDPRGGIWVWSEFDRRVFRLDEATGQSVGSLDMASLTNDPAAQPDGVISIVPNGDRPMMIVGVLAGSGHANSVVALDLSTQALLWSQPLGAGATSAPYGQFPLAEAADGSMLLIAPVADGLVHAYTLN